MGIVRESDLRVYMMVVSVHSNNDDQANKQVREEGKGKERDGGRTEILQLSGEEQEEKVEVN